MDGKKKNSVLPIILAVILAVAATVLVMNVLNKKDVQPEALPSPAAEETAAPTEAPAVEPTAAPAGTPEAEPTEVPTPAPTGTPRPKLQIDANAGAQITPTPAPQAPGITIPGWGKIELPSGETTAYAALNNPIGNEGWYYLTFELRIKETDEIVFQTGLIPPGQYCNQVELKKPLEKGDYDGILHVQPYMMDEDQTPTNNLDMDILISVK